MRKATIEKLAHIHDHMVAGLLRATHKSRALYETYKVIFGPAVRQCMIKRWQSAPEPTPLAIKALQTHVIRWEKIVSSKNPKTMREVLSAIRTLLPRETSIIEPERAAKIVEAVRREIRLNPDAKRKAVYEMAGREFGLKWRAIQESYRKNKDSRS